MISFPSVPISLFSPPPLLSHRLVCSSRGSHRPLSTTSRLLCKQSAIDMPAPLTPKSKLISLPMVLQPTPKSQKDIAEEYVTLASIDPPGVRAIHTRSLSTSSRGTTATTSSARSSCSSDDGNATQPPKASNAADSAPNRVGNSKCSARVHGKRRLVEGACDLLRAWQAGRAERCGPDEPYLPSCM